MSDTSKTAKPKADAAKRFFKDVKAELKKVIWPQRDDLVNSTGIVIASIFIIGVCIWVFDLIIGFAVGKFIG